MNLRNTNAWHSNEVVEATHIGASTVLQEIEGLRINLAIEVVA